MQALPARTKIFSIRDQTLNLANPARQRPIVEITR